MFYCKCYLQLAAIIIVSSYLVGCMVGPDFHTPAAPQTRTYNSARLPAKTVRTPASGQAGKTQRFVTGKRIPAQWWYLFHSQKINQLVQLGLKNSPNLLAAQAALQQSQEIFYEQVGSSLYPAFNVTPNATRQRFSDASIGLGSGASIFNLINTPINVTYTLDVFGGARRQLEGLKAQVDYQQFQLLAAYLTLTSNIVTTAISIASLEGQIQATHDLIKSQENQLKIIKNQFRLGGVANSAVLTQQTLVDQTRATLPPLEKSLSQSRHALAVLIGDYPNKKLPIIHLTDLTLPKHIPVSLPSKLVRQRPDVRAAEALLHAASAQIGVATANLLPQFTLTGSYGWSATTAGALFGSSSKVWSMMGQLTQPVFQGGSLFAARRAAIAAYKQSAEQYKQAVLQAFQNVADSLRAIDTDARTFRAQRQAELSAFKSLKLTKQQYSLGGVSYLDLLTAQQQYQQTRIARIQAQATRFADTVALYQALGGGWWNRKLAMCGTDPVNPMHASMTCP